MTQRAYIKGCGSYLPERVVTNDMLAKEVETSDEWIRTRTGITQRHLAADTQTTSDMAVQAARQALHDAKLTPDALDLILVATTTPDHTFPSVACCVGAALDVRCPAFDVQAVCTGFVYALTTADQFIRSGMYQTVLVIGADKLSSIVDWEDRNTCVLFGDGAGAVVLQARDQGDGGILGSELHADGRLKDILYVDGGPSSSGTVGKLRMTGKEVFKHAVEKMAGMMQHLLSAHGMEASQVDWVIPHQANQRILTRTMQKMGLPETRLISCVAEHANTSAASIPLALAHAVQEGRITRGDLLLLPAIGGGLTWGASLIRF